MNISAACRRRRGPGLLLGAALTLALAAAQGGIAATAAPSQPAATASAASLGAALVAGHVGPATATLERRTQALQDALTAYCAAPAQAQSRRQVEARYAEVVLAWQAVELLRFGPLLQDNRLERFFFFPDPRGIVQRQLRALLASADPEAVMPPSLRKRSVAVQGLPALELALYDRGAAEALAAGDDAGRYRCRYAQALAANLRDTATEIAAAWNPASAFARAFIAPSPTQDLYRDQREVAAEALKALATGLQALREIKLQPALGEDAAQARGTRLPLWRSGLSAPLMAASVDAWLSFYEAGGFGAMLGPDERWIDDNLRAEAANAAALLRELEVPLDQAIADPELRPRIELASLVLANLHAIVVEFLAPALGVDLGFNALDGD